jgi:hypothetical protein
MGTLGLAYVTPPGAPDGWRQSATTLGGVPLRQNSQPIAALGGRNLIGFYAEAKLSVHFNGTELP